jgi:hypothetical protein
MFDYGEIRKKEKSTYEIFEEYRERLRAAFELPLNNTSHPEYSGPSSHDSEASESNLAAIRRDYSRRLAERGGVPFCPDIP